MFTAVVLWLSAELSRLVREPPPPPTRVHTLPVGPPRPVDPRTKQPLTTPPTITNPRGER